MVVVKDAQPNNAQDFDFTAGGGLSPSSFQLDDDGNATLSNTRTFSDVAPGTGYSLSETVPEGWEQVSATCSDGSPVSNIDAGPAETITCTFTNRRLGDHPGGQERAARRSAGLQLHRRRRPQPVLVPARRRRRQLERPVQQPQFPGPAAGQLLDRRDGSGWMDSIVCHVQRRLFTLEHLLSTGEFVQCVFTNQKRGTITVVQDTSPDGPQDFSYTATGLTPTSFQLDDDGDNSNALSNTRTYSNLNSGTVRHLADHGAGLAARAGHLLGRILTFEHQLGYRRGRHLYVRQLAAQQDRGAKGRATRPLPGLQLHHRRGAQPELVPARR